MSSQIILSPVAQYRTGLSEVPDSNSPHYYLGRKFAVGSCISAIITAFLAGFENVGLMKP